MEVRPGYKMTEVGVIPKDWDAKTLGEIGDVRMCKRVLKHQTREHGDVPFFKIGTFGGTADAFISHALFEEFRRKYSFPKKGDVLISAAGTIGRSVVFDGAPAYFQDSNIVWIENDETKVTNAFLWHCYQVTKWVVSHGGTVARLYNNNLKTQIYVPTPPLYEQRAIAAALSDVDALLSGLDRLIAKKRDLKQAAMEQLLTGKTRLPGFSGEWSITRLRQLVVVDKFAIVDGPFGTQLKIEEYVDSGVPVIEMEHLLDDVITRDIDRCITTKKFYELIRSAVYPGDILISKTGSLGKLGIIPPTIERGLITSRLAKITLNPAKADRSFVFQVLLKLRSDGYWERVSQGGTMQILGIGMLQDAPVPEITVPEQTAIAAVFSDMDAELAALETRREKTRMLKQAMMQELLTGSTRLVNPNDNTKKG